MGSRVHALDRTPSGSSRHWRGDSAGPRMTGPLTEPGSASAHHLMFGEVDDHETDES